MRNKKNYRNKIWLPLLKSYEFLNENSLHDSKWKKLYKLLWSEEPCFILSSLLCSSFVVLSEIWCAVVTWPFVVPFSWEGKFGFMVLCRGEVDTAVVACSLLHSTNTFPEKETKQKKHLKKHNYVDNLYITLLLIFIADNSTRNTILQKQRVWSYFVIKII